ncbi:MAG: hypothetical protein KDK02_13840 [Rhodobacteraceae bacterium]|nr:hypothetical protein [Paracoccaceae bacterium]
MSFESPGAGASVAMSCRYGASRLPVRGPRRALDRPYWAFLGGSETFGKYVAHPFADLVETGSGRVCVNLGCVNAGLDAFANDPESLRIAQTAERAVIQLPGAQSLSNRYYRVHPRRNDRFLAASPMLAAIYREVDFTEFHFVRHMLRALRDRSSDRFALVRTELEQAWQARMRLLLRAIGGPAVLLWLRYGAEGGGDLESRPSFVTRAMVEALRPDVADIVEIAVRPAGDSGELGDMVFGAMQAPAAAHLIGPATHRGIADRLLRVLHPS